jgi:hypothetical protein
MLTKLATQRKKLATRHWCIKARVAMKVGQGARQVAVPTYERLTLA